MAKIKKRERKELTLECLMPFGKYKGQQVEDLLEDDPQYIHYLAEDGLSFDEEVLENLSKRGYG